MADRPFVVFFVIPIICKYLGLAGFHCLLIFLFALALVAGVCASIQSKLLVQLMIFVAVELARWATYSWLCTCSGILWVYVRITTAIALMAVSSLHRQKWRWSIDVPIISLCAFYSRLWLP